MADDPNPRVISVDFVAGKLSAIESLIATHAQNTDRRFDEVGEQLLDQNKQHAMDKAEAKRENIGRHDENKKLWTETNAMATRTDTWVTERGNPMYDAWFAVEKKKAERRLINKGRAITITKIGGLVGLIIAGLGWIGKEALAELFKKIGEALS